MPYNMSKILISQFQSYSIKFHNFKINPINSFNHISTKREWVKIVILLLGISFNMPKMLGS